MKKVKSVAKTNTNCQILHAERAHQLFRLGPTGTGTLLTVLRILVFDNHLQAKLRVQYDLCCMQYLVLFTPVQCEAWNIWCVQ
jgi:hypothetical protein